MKGYSWIYRRNASLSSVVVLLIGLAGCHIERHENTFGDDPRLAVPSFPGLSVGGYVYIESQAEPERSRFAGFSRQVVFVDAASNAKNHLTSDIYLNSHPALSPDRTKVAFLSARLGPAHLLSSMGESAPKQLYVTELASRGLRWVDSLYARENLMKGRWITDFVWIRDGSGFYFLLGSDTVFGISLSGDSLWTVMSLADTSKAISNLIASPDGTKLLCRWIETDEFPPRSGEFVWDVNKRVQKDVNRWEKSISLRGWLRGGTQLLGVRATGSLDSAFWSINVEEDRVGTLLSFHPDTSVHSIQEAQLDAEGNLIFIGMHWGLCEGSEMLRPCQDLAIIRSQTGKTEWITQDGKSKFAMSVEAGR